MNNRTEKGIRLEFVDVARGIAMICIVLGHLGDSYINKFVFTFHLPIFYLITGYFLNEKVSMSAYIKKKIKTLIVPYYFASLLIMVASIIITKFILHEEYSIEMLLRLVRAILYASGDSWSVPFDIPSIGAIWFLWATFWGGLYYGLCLS